MFPNPQDALPLPARPNLEQYKKQAKDLLRARKAEDTKVLDAWARRWVLNLAELSELKVTPGLPVDTRRWVEQVSKFAHDRLATRAKPGLADAQFVIARCHGFESWPKFSDHVRALERDWSGVSAFEAAADAIVVGDLATLQRLLQQETTLIHARSTREHCATLLHYVSANGVEGYRQKTPKNAVEIAAMLLSAGAQVDAEADVYGGGATTLELAATSVHPERAGVQEALLETLLQHGAQLNRSAVAGSNHLPIVNSCLANGRLRAAKHLASRGAALDLEAAAGIGRLDTVKGFFRGGELQNATARQRDRGFLWACEYGQIMIAEFLLSNGVDVNTDANTGQTALHCAVIGGQFETVKLLLARGASVEEKNIYGGDALGQALWCALNGDNNIDYAPIIEALLDAGAKVGEESLGWFLSHRASSSPANQRIVEILRRYLTKS